MRKLPILFIIMLLFSTAGAQSLFDAVSEGAFAAYTNAGPKLSPREQEITQKLKAVALQNPRTITWEEFMQEAEQVTQNEALWQERENALISKFLRLKGAQKATQKGISAHQGRPDYAQETRGVKYIYTSDASDHGTRSIPEEVARLLREVRQANPGARILLASEFAVRTSRFDVPICFASQPQCHMSSADFQYGPYSHLHRQALTMNIDLLGLDDDMQDDIWPKVGDTRVTYSVEDPQVQKILEATYGDKTPPYDSILYYVSFSHWGVVKRNDQWQRYIQAVSPYYDIIVVYCGNAHLDEPPVELWRLVAEPHVMFSFLSDEEIDGSTAESTYQSQLDTNIRNDEEEFTRALLEDKSIGKFCERSAETLQKNRIDTDRNFYVKTMDVTDPKLFKKWQEMYMQQFNHAYVPQTYFEVYLLSDPQTSGTEDDFFPEGFSPETTE